MSTPTPPPASRPPLPVRLARTIRHLPGLRTLEPLWDVLRQPFHAVLRLLARKRGLPLAIEGVGTLRVPPGFLTGEVDVLEVPMLRRMVGVIGASDCFYDVGASIGLHSLVAGEKLTTAGAIHAFEPDLPSCAKYWENTELVRRRADVRLSRAFVSDVPTTAQPLALFPEELTRSLERIGQQATRHLYLFGDGRREAQNGAIPCVTLDGYVGAGARPPTMVKCDIEGAELLFLRGAAETLRAHRPTLFLSVHPLLVGEFHYDVQAVYDFLASLGYRWEILNEVGESHVFATAART